jgi:hypothetical protein
MISYIAPVNKIEDKLLSGSKFENDSSFQFDRESLMPPYQQKEELPTFFQGYM